MAARGKPLGLRADMVIEEAANETSRNNSRRNSIASSSSSDSSDRSDNSNAGGNGNREPVYEPLAAASGARARTGTGPSGRAGGDASSADTEDAAPNTVKRMPTAATAASAATAATAATAPDELAPNTEEEEAAMAPPKKSILERLGLDTTTLVLMFKGSLPPVIGIAMFQSTAFADTYSTLGYLVPIVSVMTVAVMPRGKFLQTLTLNLLSVSLGAALALLVLYSGIQARAHTSGPLTPEELAAYQATGRPPYNSSQSAVCAIWLVFAIWLINMIRAKLPSMNLPSIVFSILINVCCTTGPLLINMTQAMALVKQIYTAMLTAMALSAGVSLFVFPISSRKILMAQTAGAIGLLRKAVVLQGAYLRGLEREDMYALVTVETAVGELGPAKENEQKQEKLRRKWLHHATKPAHVPPPLTKEEQAAQALRATITAMRELAGKMQLEVRFAKRDAAFGKLTAHDLGEIVKLMRSISIPVTGMSTIMDIFRRTAEHRGWNAADEDMNSDDALAKAKERRVWNEVMKQLHEPFALLAEAIDEGLEHAGLQLGLLPKTKEQKAVDREACKRRKAEKARKAADKANGVKGGDAAVSPSGSNESSVKGSDSPKDDAAPEAPISAPAPVPEPAPVPGPGPTPPPAADADADVEAATAGVVKPGDEGFADIISHKIKNFYKMRSEILRIWAKERGLMDGTVPPLAKDGSGGIDPVFVAQEQRQSQLYVLLYMEQLMIATGEAVQDFVDYADKKVADGTMDKTRFLFPTLRRIRKWAISVFNDKDTASEETSEDVLKPNFNVVFMGDGFNTKKDPEHLPPANAWQHFGNGLRLVSRFLGSAESAFGLRVACATMTVAIVCYLRVSQHFFQEQRLVWAMIIIAIGMSQTSGQSIFGFFCRVGGSALAMVFSFVIWYIVDQRTPGIIVFLWLFIFCEYYFFLKYPRFIAASMITIITQVLIIGYELQVRKIGLAKAESTGQRFYPVYELAPYRLGTVAGGSLVAFFWTIFPKPTTDRAWLRRDLSATLYLLANYFSVINETLKSTMHETGGNPDVPGTPAHRLLKVRQKLFSKLMLLLPSLQQHSSWQKWEPSIGGAFPRAAYEDIILRSGRILNYLTLISYTVTWRPRHVPGLVDDAWLTALSELIRSIGPTHYTILSTLALLSNALLSGQSLPPYIPLPRPYELTRRLLTLKKSTPASGGSDGPQRRASSASRATATGTSASGGAPGSGKQPPVRRRNSVWGKQSWRPEAGSSAVVDSGGGGMYERQTEDEAVETELPRRHRRSTAASSRDRPALWREVTDNAVSTVTGMPELTRMTTGAAAHLGRVLDARNMDEHGYTEFAVLQVCSTLVCDDLEGMIQAVSGLVGVVDFSFRMDASHESLDEAAADEEAAGEKGKGKTE
ncbi:hypothetical protein SPBR_04559 [Sporothrix brasiliensis 5110]|uniref:ER transporter 6TM N-terminal domain-containing protein n=1 Tax=Sporothrix brasiliensis 5110 TaxID=1398154 RepID=A0A0C2ENQ5_9PEZI|nr:uncharacterized protein SPBR_04559 [Sporothrix brasiliensis 5110]KIH87754.1 hypothetical protein SPBR_04559 [Sporothrix brasiliensis 5110]